jgi:hypothetical protein
MAVLDSVTEIIPTRPYSAVFAPASIIIEQSLGGSNSHSLVGELFLVAILIFFIGSLIGPVANRTTGITIPHSGFTVNPNITASPGLVPLTQLLPFLLVAVGFIGAFTLFEKRSGRF